MLLGDTEVQFHNVIVVLDAISGEPFQVAMYFEEFESDVRLPTFFDPTEPCAERDLGIFSAQPVRGQYQTNLNLKVPRQLSRHRTEPSQQFTDCNGGTLDSLCNDNDEADSNAYRDGQHHYR